MADHGEANGLNCHLDPKERKEAFGAMDKLTELIHAKMGKIKDPVKQSASIIDAWTAGPLAALASPRQCSRGPCQKHAAVYRSGMRSKEIPKVHREDRRREAGDFLASVDSDLKPRA